MLVRCVLQHDSIAVFAHHVLGETVLAPAVQDVYQTFQIGSGDENIGHLVLATELHRGTQNVACLQFQMQKYLGAFPVENNVDLFFEIRQRNIEPPAFLAGIASAIRPHCIGLVEKPGTLRFVDALNGFGFGHDV